MRPPGQAIKSSIKGSPSAQVHAHKFGKPGLKYSRPVGVDAEQFVKSVAFIIQREESRPRTRPPLNAWQNGVASTDPGDRKEDDKLRESWRNGILSVLDDRLRESMAGGDATFFRAMADHVEWRFKKAPPVDSIRTWICRRLFDFYGRIEPYCADMTGRELMARYCDDEKIPKGKEPLYKTFTDALREYEILFKDMRGKRL